jgi:hypothetical protein
MVNGMPNPIEIEIIASQLGSDQRAISPVRR